jgi:hypothetical protein
MSRHQRCTSRVSGIPTAVVLALLAALFTLGGATAAWAIDPLPAGSVALFNRTDCPEGWVVFNEAVGRLMLPPPTTTGKTPEPTGQALSDLEKRTHTHNLTLSLIVGGHSLAATTGGSNHRGNPGTYGTSTPAVTAAVWNELPYIQYLVCVKTAAPVGGLETVPRNFLMYFHNQPGQTGCPPEFDADPGIRGGRFPVAVPMHGTVDSPFGGPTMDEFGGENQHSHTASGKVLLSPKSISIASGSGPSYAAWGERDFSGTANANIVGMPYIFLPQCRKK